MVALLPIDDVYLDRHGCLNATAAASRGLPGWDGIPPLEVTPSGGFSTAHCSVCTVQHLVWAALCLFFCLPTEYLCIYERLK